MTDLLLYTLFFAFAIGAAIGSFLNVVIYRVPENLSLVSPASRCPSCETRIVFYDNIPVVSWFLLRGRCRRCKTTISFRYPFIELLTGLVSAGLWYRHFEPTLSVSDDIALLPWEWAVVPWSTQFIFCVLLIVITFVDFDTFEIPHVFTLPGMALGLASPWIYRYALSPEHIFVFWPPITPWVSLIGFFAGGLSVLIVFYGYLAMRGIEGLGGGDVTLMAMVGAWLGWPALPFIFFAASLQGVLAAGISGLLGTGFVRDSGEIFRDEEEPHSDDAESKAEEEDGEGHEHAAPDAPNDEVGDTPEERNSTENKADEVENEDEGAGERAPELDYEPTGFGAVPFGPFIALAAAEFLVFGPMLPPEFSMIYLYY